MSEPARLSYPVPHVRALAIGSVWGVAMSIEKVWEGSFIAALVALILFCGLGYWLTRVLLSTVVHSKGFIVWGWREIEWSEVRLATVVPSGLRVELRNARPAALSRAVVQDPAFREAIRVWLSTEHPVRRAMEQYYELRTW
jgi:hypothetical protein